MVTPISMRQKETLLIEMLLCGLDLRSNAGVVGSPMLVYLADLLIMRTREELDMIAAFSEPKDADGDTTT